MSISKQFLKSKPICKVTFEIEAPEAEKVTVIGDFNEWAPSSGELKKLKNGNFKGTFDLDKDQTFEFRYFIDGEFVNEKEADGFIWNDFAGAENALLKTF